MTILKAIKMTKDSNLTLAMTVDFVRKWKEEARWCRHYLPDQITMGKQFAAGVYPKKLAESLKNQRCSTMEECMQSFLSRYHRMYVQAKRTVNCYGDEEAPRKEDSKAKPAGNGVQSGLYEGCV